eukprot:TRINITY_DN61484_c0_g1_i1.p2 TRINITY_DN61484_c0_g1~~TRINITY_DN61484_c0_g1_i1.p2  ORF type:complete len:152 (-),score=28.94 TRINITY_DN61484_c0_g1_i1:411-866(-)
MQYTTFVQQTSNDVKNCIQTNSDALFHRVFILLEEYDKQLQARLDKRFDDFEQKHREAFACAICALELGSKTEEQIAMVTTRIDVLERSLIVMRSSDYADVLAARAALRPKPCHFSVSSDAAKTSPFSQQAEGNHHRHATASDDCLSWSAS